MCFEKDFSCPPVWGILARGPESPNWSRHNLMNFGGPVEVLDSKANQKQGSLFV